MSPTSTFLSLSATRNAVRRKNTHAGLSSRFWQIPVWNTKFFDCTTGKAIKKEAYNEMFRFASRFMNYMHESILP